MYANFDQIYLNSQEHTVPNKDSHILGSISLKHTQSKGGVGSLLVLTSGWKEHFLAHIPV